MNKYLSILHLFFLFFFTSGLISAQDNTPPERPYITYVTVDTANNNTIIHWTKSNSPDVEWYYIYFEIYTVNGYEGVKLDSVNASVSIYTHVNAGADNSNLMYTVTAADSSGNESLRTPGLHSAVHTTLAYDSCESEMKISWKKYVGWQDNVSGYRIYMRTANNSFSILDGVGADDSVYVHQGISENTLYEYFIEAIKNDGLISRSNIASKMTYMPPPPAGLELQYVSVPGENTAEISFNYDYTTDVNDFTLLRSGDLDSDFIPVAYADDLTELSFTFADPIITSSNKYYYKIGILNSCRRIIQTSNPGVNILLTGDTLNRQVLLNWNAYIGWPEGVSEYIIQRMDQNGDFIRAGSSSSDITTFTDELSDIPPGLSGELKYRIEAKRNNSEISSFSNILTIPVNSSLRIPNAFTPNGDGRNDVFRPILTFNPKKFLLIIYDRYGIPVFETKDPAEGWNGTINDDEKAIEGVYIYHIQFTSFNGVTSTKTGKVTVYYPR